MSKKMYANFTLEKNFKKRLVAALRSGKYKQTTGMLFDSSNGGFCCLGVMCSLRGATLDEMDGTPMPEELNSFSRLFNLYNNSAADDYFSSSHTWMVPYRGTMRFLSELNDDDHLSFKQIANIIERSVQTY